MDVPGGLCSTLFGGATPFGGQYLQSAGDGTQATTYTFANQNLGAADASRMIVVAVMAATTVTAASSCTIGGVTATKIAELSAAVSGHYQLSTIYAAMVPSGTAGDIVVGFSQDQYSCAISAYRITGRTTAAAFATNSSGTATPYSTTVNVPAPGFVIGCVSINSGASATSWTAGVTADADAAVGSRYSSASASFSSAVTGQTVSASNASGTDAGAFVVASFGPG